MRSCSLILALTSITWAIAACDQAPCPKTSVRVGNSCRPLSDAGLDEAVADAADDPDAVCGDGAIQGRETCDDGKRADGDGCSRNCQTEPGWSCSALDDVSECARLPMVPVLVGAASAAPEEVTWRWDVPEHTVSFERRLDGKEDGTQDTSSPEVRRELAEGMHTFEVRACNRIGGCSDWASYTTTVERFGTSYGSVLAGARRRLSHTLLGHASAVACNNCFVDAAGTALTLEGTLAALGTALTRGADVLDLDVIRIDEALYLARTDTTVATGQLSLSSILADARLQSSDAPLALEIAEDDSDPKVFARSLLALLGSDSRFARNGRPLLLRAEAGRLRYLEAVASEAQGHPFVSPYLRYLADDLPAGSALDDYPFLDGLLFDFRAPNLLGRIGEARKRGLSTGVLNVPGPGHGEIVLGGLREEVGLFFTSYRAEQAHKILRDPADGMYVSSLGQGSLDVPLAVQRFENGAVTALNRALGVPSGVAFGTPGLAAVTPLAGGVLDFSATDRALKLADTPIQGTAEGGILVSGVMMLPDLNTIAANTRRTLLSSGQNKGFALVLTRNAGADVSLSFTAHVAGAERTHRYPAAGGNGTACSSKNGTFVEALVSDRAYWLVGVYDGDGQILLFIDGRCAGAVPVSIKGPLTATESPPLLGATPDTAVGLGARDFFRGFAQSAQVLQWSSRDLDVAN